ncbi:glycerol kinase GlpK [Microbacterium maritypicum]|uniref:glycerol kinase GlpK n=1 Tax=Microbacterium maritypicum TaxID=33918 RepID=UPI00296FCB1C|nr:glycerol kinase GlpK [Microbacterium liquefaciens]
MAQHILALDQGTTSSRAIVFDHDGRIVSVAQQEFPQILPVPGEVEHDPEAIWSTQIQVAKDALAKADLTAREIAGIGITNQRETTILWERDSGRPVDNAIVWQSRVSAPICDQLRADGHAEMIRQKTGLILDAYFSGTKIKHLFESHEGLRQRAAQGEILFGTVDTFLAWRLSEGKYHVTDASNASRTLLYNIHSLEWDDELLEILDIPRAMLPEVVPCSGVFGETAADLFGQPIPIAGMAGDQQAAMFGQVCFEPGSAKNTYGTGCFLLLNTGDQPVLSKNQMLTTIGWQIGDQVTYCLEGSVFIGGAVVQWLRDGLGIIENSADVETLAASVEDSAGVVLVPAFVGLGAPHWDPHARGSIFGITRGTTAGHLARAAVESMAFQSCDVLDAMQKDAGLQLESLRVDGGAAGNDALMQFQADVLGVPVVRPVVAETTALGAAYAAGLAVGFWNGLDDLSANWQEDKRWEPSMEEAERDRQLRLWRKAITKSMDWVDDDVK